MVVSERNHADAFVDAVSCSCSHVESLVFQSQKDQLVILLFVEELVERDDLQLFAELFYHQDSTVFFYALR
jgi:hypothetical protein